MDVPHLPFPTIAYRLIGIHLLPSDGLLRSTIGNLPRLLPDPPVLGSGPHKRVPSTDDRHLSYKQKWEGIALAKKRGVYKGRKPSLTAEQVKEIRRRVVAGEQKTGLAAEYGVSRQTLYTALI